MKDLKHLGYELILLQPATGSQLDPDSMPDSRNSSPTSQLISELHSYILKGDWEQVLTHEQLRWVWTIADAIVPEDLATWRATHDHEEGIIQFMVAVAALHLFVQQNWSGPRITLGDNMQKLVHADEGQMKAMIDSLKIDGEDVNQNILHLKLFCLAMRILDVSCTKDEETLGTHVASHWPLSDAENARDLLLSWWKARCGIIYQNLLGARSVSICTFTRAAFGQVLGMSSIEERYEKPDHTPFDTDGQRETQVADSSEQEENPIQVISQAVASDTGASNIYPAISASTLGSSAPLLTATEQPYLYAMACLELGVYQSYMQMIGAARYNLDHAKEAIQFNFQLKGVLGVRTKFQQNPVAQLTIVQSSGNALEQSSSAEQSSSMSASSTPPRFVSLSQYPYAVLPKHVDLNDTDFLGYTSFVNKDDVNKFSFLIDLEQALLLDEAYFLSYQQAKHELRQEQIISLASYILYMYQTYRNEHNECSSPCATTDHTLLNPVSVAQSLLLRTEHELDRSGRYMERSMGQMEELQQYFQSDRPLAKSTSTMESAISRVKLIYSIPFPMHWELSRKLAMILGKLGLVKSAIDIFSSLKMWDEVIDCYRLMGNVAKAEQIVREEIRKRGETPMLCCLLGDVTSDDSMYLKAWEISNKRQARAMRSLGRSYVRKQKYHEAVGSFEQALALNPLHPDVWFAMSHACMMIEDYKKGAFALTRAAQTDPNNGEIWNNLARCLYETGMKREACLAMKEAVKHLRESHRVWDNYLMLTLEQRDDLNATHAMAQLLELQGKDGIRAQGLEQVVSSVIESGQSSDPAIRFNAASLSKRLFEVLGRATSLVSSVPEIWDSYARLQQTFGTPEKHYEARQRQIRALGTGQMVPWASEETSFLKMCDASLGLGISVMQMLEAEGDKKLPELHATIIHHRNILQRAREAFENHAMYKDLQGQLETLEKLEGSSTPH